MIAKYSFLADTISAGAPSAFKVHLKDSTQQLAKTDFVGSFVVDSISSSNDTTSTVFFHSYSMGQVYLDSVPLKMNNSDSALYLKGKGPFVVPVNLDTNYKSSYYGFANYPFPKGEVALIGLGFVLFSLILFFIIKKIFFTKKEEENPISFIRDKRKTPIEMYNELMKLKFWENNKIKDHYYALAEIVKYFLTLQTDESFMEMTTKEMLDILTDKYRKLFEKEYLGELRMFFKNADIYRYTTIEPDVDAIEKHNDVVYRLISFQKEAEVENT